MLQSSYYTYLTDQIKTFNLKNLHDFGPFYDYIPFQIQSTWNLGVLGKKMDHTNCYFINTIKIKIKDLEFIDVKCKI